MNMDLASCHTQHNILGFIYAPRPNKYGSDGMPNLTSLDSTTRWAPINIDLTMCQNQHSWFNYTPSPSEHEFSKLGDLISLGSVIRWAQAEMSLTSYQTQRSWGQLHAELKRTWVWQTVWLTTHELSIMLGPSGYGLAIIIGLMLSHKTLFIYYESLLRPYHIFIVINIM